MQPTVNSIAEKYTEVTLLTCLKWYLHSKISATTPKPPDSVIQDNCQCCHLTSPAPSLLYLADDTKMAAAKELDHLNCKNTAVPSLDDLTTQEVTEVPWLKWFN